MSLQVKRELDRHELRISLLHLKGREEGQLQPLTSVARVFLARYVSSAVLEVLPRVARDSQQVSPTSRGGLDCLRPSERAEVSARWASLLSLLNEILTQEGQS